MVLDPGEAPKPRLRELVGEIGDDIADVMVMLHGARTAPVEKINITQALRRIVSEANRAVLMAERLPVAGDRVE